MHAQAAAFIQGVAASWPSPRRYVVEFGSRCVNGSARDLIQADAWYGVDLIGGPGVDEVVPAELVAVDPRHRADTVVCTEVLEHTPEGAAICRNAYRILEDGGVFVLTCAGPTRTPHGAGGNPHPRPDEYYGNLTVMQLAGWLRAAGFGWHHVTTSWHDQADLYAVAVRFSEPPAPPAPSPPLRGWVPNVRAHARTWRR